MTTKTVRYTATLPSVYLDELKELANEKKISSVNFAIKEAVCEYLTNKKMEHFKELMQEAGQDEAFLSRTLTCADDFSMADSEVVDR